MGKSAVQYKIMPESPNTDLNKLKEDIKTIIEKKSGVVNNIEEQPIAFGLKALIVSFAFPEENEIEEVENELEKISEISSTEMIDYRRAIG